MQLEFKTPTHRCVIANVQYLRRLGINLLLADTVGIGVTLNSGVENCSFFVTAALFGFGVAPLPPVLVLPSPPSFCCFVNGSSSMLSFPLLKAMISTIKLSQMSFVHTNGMSFHRTTPTLIVFVCTLCHKHARSVSTMNRNCGTSV